MALLVVENFFESEEVFPRLLIELLLDIPINSDELRNHHMLQRIYSPVRYFNLLVQSQERGLQRGDLNQQLQDASKLLTTFLDRVSTPLEAYLAH